MRSVRMRRGTAPVGRWFAPNKPFPLLVGRNSPSGFRVRLRSNGILPEAKLRDFATNPVSVRKESHKLQPGCLLSKWMIAHGHGVGSPSFKCPVRPACLPT